MLSAGDRWALLLLAQRVQHRLDPIFLAPASAVEIGTNAVKASCFYATSG